MPENDWIMCGFGCGDIATESVITWTGFTNWIFEVCHKHAVQKCDHIQATIEVA